ncbi:MAG: 2-aminoethylphosphonate--pyruvate transaminase [Deltaproteobacteria bacterium]|nr:2-aminoethylphosphonate--pyruvate transaminase [Deltaproteobacteria bacterium]
MTQNPNDSRLLTPGPLTTSQKTKLAMLHDWGSRDTEFIEINRRFRKQLLEMASAEPTHVCVPMQGSGTFIVEAVLGSLIPPEGKALILINGAYGRRMTKMMDYLKREYLVHETPEDTVPILTQLDSTLARDSKISHVLVVHCETTSGILNPIDEIANIVARHARSLLIDAMSAFGAIPLEANQIRFDAVMASSNKCLEGIPGMGFALIRKDALERSKGNAHSLSLDLYDQWKNMETTSQWRFTPPTHVIVAFDKALQQFHEEGGVIGRNKRYVENCRILIDGMSRLGFETLLPPQLQAPIIITFKMPEDPKFDFSDFYERVKEKGFVLYPGKLTVAPSFRIGCIGHLFEDDMHQALGAIEKTMGEMGVASGKPSSN